MVLSNKLSSKKVLYIDLFRETFEIKLHNDFDKYLGGVGLSAKIISTFDLEDRKNLMVFSVGPFNGYFPFASKTSILINTPKQLKDQYLGGSLSWRLKMSGLDAIVLKGVSRKGVVLEITNGNVSFKSADTDLNTLGLPGKTSIISTSHSNQALLDGYFTTADGIFTETLKEKQVYGIVLIGTKVFEIKDTVKYKEIYKKIMSKIEDVEVEPVGNPSCSGCPLGCSLSKIGEESGDFLVHSLVACGFAKKIYSDTNLVFSCLNVLNYGFTHEDLENFPNLVYDLVEEIKKVNNA